MSVALHLSHVSRAYPGRSAVADVTITAPAGQVLTLLGASGSGKSTLLRLIAGLEPVDAGEIHIGDALVSAPGRTLAPESRRVGLVFQDYALFPHLTAAQNVAFGLSRSQRRAAAAAGGDLARAWLDRVGLGHRTRAFPHELSGGEQQRVAIARALAPQPVAVLLDEPFSGLDPHLRGELRDSARAAVREAGATAVFVTHDADEALYMADQLAILTQGRLEQAGDPREVYRRPISLAAAAALGPMNVWRGRVAGARLDTPFGATPAPSALEGQLATAAARVEALAISPGQGATVVERRPQGRHDLIAVRAQDVVWRGLIGADQPLAPGQTCAVRLRDEGVFVFAA